MTNARRSGWSGDETRLLWETADEAGRQGLPLKAVFERIARETLDIYAPLARSIGCHRICTELEELAFIHLNPVARDRFLETEGRSLLDGFRNLLDDLERGDGRLDINMTDRAAFEVHPHQDVGEPLLAVIALEP